MIHVIGLTGQSGAGKTLVSACFAEHGFAVIDADRVCHEVMEQQACMAALQNAFGNGIVSNGHIDRKALGRMVFSDPEQLALLNRTIFPFITGEIERRIFEADKAGLEWLLLDAPTLYEAGADRLCEFVLAVCADYETRRARIMERDGLTIEVAELRLGSQHGDDFYKERADAVLVNNGPAESLYLQAEEIIRQLRRRFSAGEEE